ncbi:MAG TPA: universal stress protein [Woeseiaceae bacterium]|nr:universal stress protein [Woeseiaceae bacterium]
MQRFRNILCVVDKPSDAAALERAVSLAENNQSALTLARVIPRLSTDMRLPEGGPTSEALREWTRAQHLESLEAMARPFGDRIDLALRLLEGTEFLQVIRAVLADGYDLVIKAAEDPPYLRRLFGADDMHLLRKCPCPLWLTRPAEKTNYGRILAAVDFDPAEPQQAATALNRTILELAAALSVSDFAELHVVHAWDAPAEDVIRRWAAVPDSAAADYAEAERSAHARGLEHIGAQLKDWLGDESYDYIAPRYHLARGPAVTAVPHLVTELEADLVVMGTVARTGISGLIIGNTAESILEQLPCAVLAVKGPGFVSPVRLPR